MIIRRATYEDIPTMMRIFEAAKAIMRASGNLHQWGSGYPNEDVLKRDIDAESSYIVCNTCGEVVATMAFIPGPDQTYSVIYDGEWPDDNPYYVIHRIAVASSGGGIARQLLDWAFERTDTLRIDTHRDNCIMHHILRKYGFVQCGVIKLANGDDRDAYHLTKKKSLDNANN